MKKLRMISLFLFTVALSAQQVNPNTVLVKVKEKLNKVEDYSVEALVKLDVDFLKVPDTKTKIYFKQPDKVKMESDGFALLPKQSFNFSPAMLLKEDYTAVFAKEDTVEGNDVYLIKILPLSDTSQVILSNLWIDESEYVVRKIETTTKNSGTVTIFLKYANQIQNALPSQLIISFKIEGKILPRGHGSETETDVKSKNDDNISGTVTIDYSNYVINQGIDDEFFEEKEDIK